MTLIVTLCGTAAMATDGSYIVRTDPLSFNTAFKDSKQDTAISMACGSKGRPDCQSAFTKLENLTDSPSCRDHFFIALDDRSKFAPDDGVDTEPWLQFSYKAGEAGILIVEFTPDEDLTSIECNEPYRIMKEAVDSYSSN